jgi:hypothetical protein
VAAPTGCTHCCWGRHGLFDEFKGTHCELWEPGSLLARLQSAWPAAAEGTALACLVGKHNARGRAYVAERVHCRGYSRGEHHRAVCCRPLASARCLSLQALSLLAKRIICSGAEQKARYAPCHNWRQPPQEGKLVPRSLRCCNFRYAQRTEDTTGALVGSKKSNQAWAHVGPIPLWAITIERSQIPIFRDPRAHRIQQQCARRPVCA